ncbi:MAG: beta-lactamase family protein [Cyclobacteriaceae bacterium]|nr:beta-lactamase family protein [Cyclobacteriaceae bacterium]
MRKLLVLFIVTLMGCSKQPSFEQDVDSIFSYLDGNRPGGAVMILKNDSVVFRNSYGLADLSSQEEITSKTLFNTGSISKTFVAYVVLALAQEGKLSLNDSIAKYFPDFKNPELAKKVRIHHLLTHTSGLPDNRWQHLDSVFLLTAKDAENWNPIKLNDSLNFEPGTRFEYSNPAFNGLALIIEKVTGNKWQDEVKNRIFIPAGMNTSTITDGPYPTTGVAHAYLQTATGYIEKDYGEEPTFAAAGNGGVWSSVDELALYEKALRDRTILNEEIITASRTIKEYPNWQDAPAFMGTSWFIAQTDDGYKMIYHTGTQGGFYGDYVSIPEKGILYLMLCNTPTPQEEKRTAVLAALKKYNWLD